MLIVGLGNPGNSYQNHRHNVGFMALDALNAQYGTGDFKSQFRHEGGGLISKIVVAGKPVYLLKPQNYMNQSGKIVQAALRFYKITCPNMLVIHDELDIEFGRMRAKFAGGAGGHNGLRSIDALVGKDYWRLRMGIGHPGHKDLVTSYVLHDFDHDERAKLPDMFRHINQHIIHWLDETQREAMFISHMGQFRLPHSA